MTFCNLLVKRETSKKLDVIPKKKFVQNVFTNCGSYEQNEKKDLQIDIDNIFYNIFFIDQKIKKYFIEQKKTLNKLYDELNICVWIQNNSKNRTDKISANKNIKILRETIIDIEKLNGLYLYNLLTFDLLRKYKTVLNKSSTRKNFLDVCSTNNDNKNDNDKILEKIRFDYLLIAKDYITLTNFKQTSTKMQCECLNPDLVQIDETLYSCEICGLVTEIIDENPTFKDISRVNMTSKYTYTKRGHFVDAIDKFEGKQNTFISEKIYKIIYDNIKFHSLTKDNITKDQLYMFLSENGLSSYYEDINLLYFNITGIKPPDISKHKQDLIIMFDQAEDVYNKIKDPSRINSLNVNYKLFKFLQLLGCNCKKDDFYILKTKGKVEEHDEKWKEICEMLRWKFIETD